VQAVLAIHWYPKNLRIDLIGAKLLGGAAGYEFVGDRQTKCAATPEPTDCPVPYLQHPEILGASSAPHHWANF
jgi:hypothetical protein